MNETIEKKGREGGSRECKSLIGLPSNGMRKAPPDWLKESPKAKRNGGLKETSVVSRAQSLVKKRTDDGRGTGKLRKIAPHEAHRSS